MIQISYEGLKIMEHHEAIKLYEEKQKWLRFFKENNAIEMIDLSVKKRDSGNLTKKTR